MAGGVRRLMFTDKSVYNFNKYVPGSGVGGLNISVRRHLNRFATPDRSIQTNASAKKIPCSVNYTLEIITLKIGAYEITAEVTDKLGSGGIGLMGRTHLAENHGMMFIFDIPIKAYVWNKNTPLALDIAFLDCSGTILEIFQLQPNDETTIESTTNNVIYAIEVNQGWFAARNIVPGMKVYD
jgi:uncharacterized membrane protein (UPF0127 family)